MCGIFCIVGKNSKELNIKKILDVQQHRGPDFSNYISINDLVLGSNRLKIIDLSDDANMPLNHGPINIVFNGFISNFKTLRKEMMNSGIKFKTNCDTEVLAAMLHVYPYDLCLSKLEGMWAFVAFDKIKNKLIISRDDFGIKPLFYYQDANNLILASEINTLKSFLDLKINYQNLGKYFFANSFNSDYIGVKNTFFKNINSFPAKSYSIIELSKKKNISSFIKIERNYQNKKIDDKGFLNLIDNKFNEYGISDVKKCIPLSAGIDSNIINYYYKNHSNTYAYSIEDNDELSKSNEGDLIKKFTSKLSIPHEFINLEKIVSFNFFEKIVQKFNSPISSPVLVNAAALRYHANQRGVKVLYSGHGGDELFGGYMQQYIFLLKYFLKQKKFSKALNLFLNGGYVCSHNRDYNQSFISYLKGIRNIVKILKSNSYFKNSENFENQKFFSHNFNFKKDNDLSLNNPWEYNLHLIENIRMPYWLSSDDHISSMYSIENRVPFLNQEIVSASENFYVENSFKKLSSKFYLRKNFSDKLNKEILKNKIKLNQPGSFDKFIFEKFYDESMEIFKNTTFFTKNIVSEFEKSRKFYDDYKKGYVKNNRTNSSFLFKALSFEIFLKSI